MNREIKFRLCHTAQNGSKTIHYQNNTFLIGLGGTIYENYGMEWKSPMWETVFDGEVFIQQFTGLKDKNGKEVYEGDILEWSGKFIAEIFWCEEDAAFQIKSKSGGAFINHLYMLNFHVIGNIFENPELLK